jgi:hypothetical protein
MRNASMRPVALGGLALLVLVLTTPASADPGRHHWQPYWDDHKPNRAQKDRRHRSREEIFSGNRHYRYFGDDPDRYFGVGPGSYECFGYDCTW